MQYTHIIKLCGRMSIIYGGIWAKNTKYCWIVCAVCRYGERQTGNGNKLRVPLALFAQECYTLAIKDSALSAGFFRDKEKRLCESD